MHPRMAIIASRDGALEMTSRDGNRSIPGWLSLHTRMAMDASRDGILRWRSIQHGMASQPPRVAIDASRDGNRCIPGGRSMHPRMALDASRDGDHCIPGWRSRDNHGCIPGWRRHPVVFRSPSTDASIAIPGCIDRHPGMLRSPSQEAIP